MSVRDVAAVLAMAVVLVPAAAQAYCLRNCPTDDSVCDLSPNASYALFQEMYRRYGNTVLEKSPASSEERVEILTRVASATILEFCKPGQTLAVQTTVDIPYMDRTVNGIVSLFCRVADVRRQNWRGRAPYGSPDDVDYLRAECVITKWDEPKAAFEGAERTTPTVDLIRVANGQKPRNRESDAGLRRLMEKEVSGGDRVPGSAGPCLNALVGSGGCPRETGTAR